MTFEAGVRVTCEVCKDYSVIHPRSAIARHPALVAFYCERGVPVQWEVRDWDSFERWMELEEQQERILSADPPRAEVTVPFEGEELRLTLDETVSVVDIVGPRPVGG